VSDRLQDLQRQRALVQEQLAWLDREIAAIQKNKVSVLPPEPAAIAIPVTSPKNVPISFNDAAAAERAAEEILSQYQQENQSLQKTVKRGCLLYFFAALGLLVVGVFVLYLVMRR
jgi:hypothetical protein